VAEPVKNEGPVLETLTRRVAETPDDFVAEPRLGGKGAIEVAAVVGDLCGLLGTAATAGQLDRFSGVDPRRDRNRLAVVLLLSWLLADDWFRQARPPLPLVLALLGDGADELATLTAAGKFVTDPDRREELVRFALARLELRPAGETVAQAQDRLTTLSAVERARVLAASRDAEQRARAIREALVRKAAEESADKYTRE
jgi:hypothetical protein